MNLGKAFEIYKKSLDKALKDVEKYFVIGFRFAVKAFFKKLVFQNLIYFLFHFSNLTHQSSSMTSLASTLSDSNKIMSNSTPSQNAPSKGNNNPPTTNFAGLNVSDLESPQYDSINAENRHNNTNNVNKVDFWASNTSSNAEWNRGNPVIGKAIFFKHE